MEERKIKENKVKFEKTCSFAIRLNPPVVSFSWDHSVSWQQSNRRMHFVLIIYNT